MTADAMVADRLEFCEAEVILVEPITKKSGRTSTCNTMRTTRHIMQRRNVLEPWQRVSRFSVKFPSVNDCPRAVFTAATDARTILPSALYALRKDV